MDRRKVLLVGLVLFLLGNLFSALAINPLGLYLARMAAACGAGMFTPVAAGVVVEQYRLEMLGWAGGVCGLVALLQLMVSQRWATARIRRNTV